MASPPPLPPPPPPPMPPSFLETGCRHHAYSRKQKSLGLLCSNFVSLYNRDDVESVGLDDAARRLGVERRRIYDIVNVLESVGVLARKAKNRYSWIGFSGIPKALEDLKFDQGEALRGISGSYSEDYSTKVSDDEDDEKSADQMVNFESEKLSPTFNPSASSSACCRTRSDQRKEKSLGLLTRNFVKLFLTTQADTISLDEAAKILLGDGHETVNMRNHNAAKVRRLYDIANVLSSLNLIEKTQQLDTRKPAFRWLGTIGKPKEDNGVTIAIPPAPTTKQPNKRAFGTEITNVDLKRSRLNSAVDKKPNKMQMRSDDLKQCNLTAQQQLQGSKAGFVFGPFQPTAAMKGGGDGQTSDDKVRDWESLASSFRPEYHNQALSDLFAHYMEAWKSWYSTVTQGSSALPLPFSNSVFNQLL